MRKEEDVINRIKHDQGYQPTSEWIIGYEDRFKDDLIEVSFDDFMVLRKDDDTFIPLHRIRIFKRNDIVVWDRRIKMDLLFKEKN